MKSILLPAAAAIALICAAAPAAAEELRRYEVGSIEFSIAGPVSLTEPVVVRPGEAAWTDAIRPRHWVRLTSDGAARNRPGRTAGSPAGTLMFGYTLQSGMAYCPALTLGPNAQRVQCLRDVNNDGAFDGSYVTRSRGMRSRLMVGGLQGLSPMPQVRYEPVDPALGDAIPVEVAFVGWENGVARFRMRIENEWSDTDKSCIQGEADACTVFGLTLQVTPGENGAANIAPLSAADERHFTVAFDEG